MSKEERNSTGKDRRYEQEHTEAVFCEELLDCFVCGKIFFSRTPIELPTLQRRSLHVCNSCSRDIKCSICYEPVTAEMALFIENLPEADGGLLCPRCKEKVFLSFRPSPQGVRRQLRAAAVSVQNTISRFFRRILSIRIRRG
jgi:DNA-directed RNA polymerase subunit RPC12/RpoP